MTISATEYEKLGAFYLGREYDIKSSSPEDSLVMYDSKDLVTHGVVLGMTGSGKTGLCLTLIEEAAMDNIPAIIIDPKGDIANLLLTFPDLAPEDFEPWVNEEDAVKKGKTVPEFAAAQAEMWKKGLGDWGMDGERIAQLREKTDICVFTPGSNAGIPVSILSSFQAPPFEVIDDAETFSERIESTVSSLLALVGVDADPIQSKEHILLSNILSTRWRAGEDMTLARLISDIQNPPFGQVGALDLDTFFSEKKRTELAMGVNNLLAAPGFQAWMEGVPLDIKAMLHTPKGKPRLAIFSIAHLNDTERMFFVSLLLNQMVGWMRAQSGTTSLRALLYMDEIYGYLPPTQNPPSKKPMLILLKQARAFGLGVLLATQNPVDLDYKALSNMGTWWLGRLQTERDKNRVLDGLEGAAASQNSAFDRGAMEQLLAGLGNRIFLMNNAKDSQHRVFQVRWCLSYLRGPLTRTQIKTLIDPMRAEVLAALPKPKPTAVRKSARSAKKAPVAAEEISDDESASSGDDAETSASIPGAGGGAPAVAKQVVQYYIEANAANPNDLAIVYQPHLLRAAEILFSDAKKGLSGKKLMTFIEKLEEEHTVFDLQAAAELEGFAVSAFAKTPTEGISYQGLPSFAMSAASYTAAKGEFIEHCYVNGGLDLFYHEALDAWSEIDETEGEFRTRLGQRSREARDQAMTELRRTFAKKAQPLEERLRRAEAAVEKEKSEKSGAWLQSAVTIGGALLGGIFGGRKGSSLMTGVKSASQAWRQGGDVDRAEDTVESINGLLNNLEAEMNEAVAKLTAEYDMAQAALQTQRISPLKKNIVVTACGLAWLPFFKVSASSYEPAWE